MPGTLAERIVVPAVFAWPVPEDWGDGDAVCAEPLTVALAAVRRAMTIKAEPGRCLVIGAGSQGTLACVALAAGGITPAVLDPQPGRRALAAELGARQAARATAGSAWSSRPRARRRHWPRRWTGRPMAP